MKPIFLGNAKAKDEFKGSNNVEVVIDRYDDLIEDLFLTRNPRFKFDKNYQGDLASFKTREGKKDEIGVWVYFPWSKTLIYYLNEPLHHEMRTARNKDLITEEEQNKFYNFKVGIAGLSVGSHAALTMVMMGGGRLMRLADPDVISPSNLNRIRSSFADVGRKKCDVVEATLYEINPYAEIEIFEQGITSSNLEEFVCGLDVVVDAIDNLELKIRLRLCARDHRIPVIMATDNADNVIIDIERYDLDGGLELFNGVIGSIGLEEFQRFELSDMPKLATRIAGAEFVVPRMLQSVAEVGRTLYSWPQLGSAATLSGVCTAYAIRRLALGQAVRAGKFEVNLDAIFDPDYHFVEAVESRDSQRKAMLVTLGLA
jgi:tRNA threonylcarbamoyladenosine dehydratase